MKEWFYLIDEKRFGPFQVSDLKGKITKETLVWSKGMDEWDKAENLSDLQFLFKSPDVPPPPPTQSSSPPPPPPPPPKNNQNPITEKIDNGILYSWVLIILSAGAVILEMMGKEESKLYGLIMFLTLTALIRVLLSIKSYFKNTLNFFRANENINWLIITYIPIFLFGAFLMSRFSELPSKASIIIGLIILIAGILNIYHTIRFYFKLNGIEGYGISYFKRFASLLITLFFVSTIHFIFISEETSIVIAVLEVLPYVFLLLGFYDIKNKLK